MYKYAKRILKCTKRIVVFPYSPGGRLVTERNLERGPAGHFVMVTRRICTLIGYSIIVRTITANVGHVLME